MPFNQNFLPNDLWNLLALNSAFFGLIFSANVTLTKQYKTESVNDFTDSVVALLPPMEMEESLIRTFCARCRATCQEKLPGLIVNTGMDVSLVSNGTASLMYFAYGWFIVYLSHFLLICLTKWQYGEILSLHQYVVQGIGIFWLAFTVGVIFATGYYKQAISRISLGDFRSGKQ